MSGGVKVMPQQIDDLIRAAEWQCFTAFEKCTIAVCKLPSGFVLTESSACISPSNYDFELGKSICRDRIINRLWELEGYRLQTEVSHFERQK